MKTAFKAKLVFVTDKRNDIGSDNEFTYVYMLDTINKKKVDIEIIGDIWTNDQEPVIIIRDKS